MEHLIDFFERYIRGPSEALVYDDGFRRWRWPQRGTVRVTFGAPLMLEGDDYVALARRVQEGVVALQRLPVETSLRAPDAAA